MSTRLSSERLQTTLNRRSASITMFTSFDKNRRKLARITEFYTRLRLLARKCEFTDPPLEIKRQIIQGTTSVRLRRKNIEQGLSLEKLLRTARAMETADEQTSEMEKQHSHAVVHNRNKIADKKPKRDARPKAGSHHTKCGLCGGNYPHQGNCPAQGKTAITVANQTTSPGFAVANPMVNLSLPTQTSVPREDTMQELSAPTTPLLVQPQPQRMTQVMTVKSTLFTL